MRQIISTSVVAVVIGAVAGATMGAMAQSGPEAPAQQAIVPAVTSINAHKVDGRHAVSASASRKKRSGKLVATNKQGYLPNNIIKPAWKLIGGKPAAFRDGQIGWGEVQNKPPGFADGVDDAGYLSVTQPATYTVAGGGTATAYADSPIGTDVELTIIPEPGKHLEVGENYFWRGPSSAVGPYPELPAGSLRHEVKIVNSDYGTPVTFRVRIRVFGSAIAPAALKLAAKQVRVGAGKDRPKARQ